MKVETARLIREVKEQGAILGIRSYDYKEATEELCDGANNDK